MRRSQRDSLGPWAAWCLEGERNNRNCIRPPEERGTERTTPQQTIPIGRDSQEVASRGSSPVDSELMRCTRARSTGRDAFPGEKVSRRREAGKVSGVQVPGWARGQGGQECAVAVLQSRRQKHRSEDRPLQEKAGRDAGATECARAARFLPKLPPKNRGTTACGRRCGHDPQKNHSPGQAASKHSRRGRAPAKEAEERLRPFRLRRARGRSEWGARERAGSARSFLDRNPAEPWRWRRRPAAA